MITIAWPVVESSDAPLSKSDKKFIKDNTKKDDKKKSSDSGGDDFESKHPRAAAGSPAGGEFIAGDSGSSDDDKKDKGKKSGGKDKPGAGGLALKTGYDKPNGDARVKGLQAQLNKFGFRDAAGKPLDKDGKLGPKTTAAIKRAQKALGMKPTGKADGAFLQKMKGMKLAGSVGKSKPKTTKDKPPPPKRPLAGSARGETKSHRRVQ